MTVHLDDLFDPDLFDQMLFDRYIRVRADEELPVLVYDYTERAQYKRAWNPVTLGCRGLLVHAETGEVIARGFAKFFNYGESLAAPVGDGPVEVFDKVDGSLGILYRVPGTDTHRISTRGSLRSPQATAGTAIWNDKYADVFTPNPEWTYLFEIVDPSTRVVVDYGETRDLVLLGALDTATGADIDFATVAADWPGPVVTRFHHPTLAAALAAAPRENAEGFVVRDPATGNRVKIKQEDYKRLHAVITGLRKVDLWMMLAVDDNPHLEPATLAKRLRLDPAAVAELRAHRDGALAAALERVPDELYRAVHAAAAELRAEVVNLTDTLTAGYQALDVDPSDRKAGAATIIAAAPDRFTQAVWLNMMNGNDNDALMWLGVRPEPTDFVLDWATTNTIDAA